MAGKKTADANSCDTVQGSWFAIPILDSAYSAHVHSAIAASSRLWNSKFNVFRTREPGLLCTAYLDYLSQSLNAAPLSGVHT